MRCLCSDTFLSDTQFERFGLKRNRSIDRSMAQKRDPKKPKNMKDRLGCEGPFKRPIAVTNPLTLLNAISFHL